MKYFQFILCFTLFISFSLVEAAELRNWTGSNGKIIKAEFVSYDSDTEIVKIKLRDGREQNVKIYLFSKKDQEFVKSGGKSDNPFGTEESKLTGPLRITLSISERGGCKYRIEKATEPYKDDFVGEPIKLKLLPKTKTFKAKDGTLKMVYDFSDSDSLPDWLTFRKHCSLDNQKKELILTSVGKEHSDNSFANFSRRPFFPVTLVLELTRYEDSNMLFYFGGKSGNFTFNHYFQQSQPHFLKVDGDGKQVFKSEPYPLKGTLECEFELPLKDKAAEPFMFNIRQLSPDKKIAFSKITLIGRMSPILMAGLEERDSALYFTKIATDGIGYLSGLRDGDKLKSINAKTYRNKDEAMRATFNMKLTEKNIIVVERGDKTLQIEIE